jgi:hypothetical protein
MQENSQPTPQPPQTQNPQDQTVGTGAVGADPSVSPTPQPPVEQTPIPPHQKSPKKLITLIIIILLLGLSSGGAFAYLKYFSKTPATPSETFSTPTPSTEPTATPDPTADWQTYSSQEMGISFKYPKYLHPETEYLDLNYRRISLVSEPNKPVDQDTSICQTYPKGYFSISFFTKTNDYNTLKIFSERGQKNVEPKSINGINGYIRTDSPIVTIEDEDEYISFFSCDVKEFDQILSTFEFIDQTNVDTSEWKTYTNQFIGYSLKHPSNWLASQTNEETPFKASDLTISNNNYSISIKSTTAGYGGVICVFNDSSQTRVAGPSQDTLLEPTEIGILFNAHARRNSQPISTLDQYGASSPQFSYIYRVCIKGENLQNDGKYHYSGTARPNNITTEITYITPQQNIDTNMLTIMDKIVTSMTETQ